MRRPLAGLLLLLLTGCSTPAATPAPPAAGSAEPAAGAVERPAGGLTAASDFRVRLVPTQEATTGSDGRPRVQWDVDWSLTWASLPGARDYAVWFGTNEGAGNEPRRFVDEPALRLTAATGTSVPDRVEVEREAGLLFTSSQLLVSVAGRDAQGRLGPRSPWFPVGDAPADGRPIGTEAPGH